MSAKKRTVAVVKVKKAWPVDDYDGHKAAAKLGWARRKGLAGPGEPVPSKPARKRTPAKDRAAPAAPPRQAPTTRPLRRASTTVPLPRAKASAAPARRAPAPAPVSRVSR